MFNFFSSILSTIEVFINFFISMVTGLYDFLLAMARGVAYLIGVVALLPVQIQATAITIIGISVIFTILNR